MMHQKLRTSAHLFARPCLQRSRHLCRAAACSMHTACHAPATLRGVVCTAPHLSGSSMPGRSSVEGTSSLPMYWGASILWVACSESSIQQSD